MHKNQARSAGLLRRLGITFKQYKKLFRMQDGRCAICGYESKVQCSDETAKLDLVVDHCHTTGKVRALLCNHCNTGLGFFRDNVDALQGAINYLQVDKTMYQKMMEKFYPAA